MGRFWATNTRRASNRSVAELERECLELGIHLTDESAIDASPSEFDVLPEHWPALELFLALETQWRRSPMGGLTGLDYSAVHAVMAMHCIPVSQQRQRLDELSCLERGALSEMSKPSGQ